MEIFHAPNKLYFSCINLFMILRHPLVKKFVLLLKRWYKVMWSEEHPFFQWDAMKNNHRERYFLTFCHWNLQLDYNTGAWSNKIMIFFLTCSWNRRRLKSHFIYSFLLISVDWNWIADVWSYHEEGCIFTFIMNKS